MKKRNKKATNRKINNFVKVVVTQLQVVKNSIIGCAKRVVEYLTTPERNTDKAEQVLGQFELMIANAAQSVSKLVESSLKKAKYIRNNSAAECILNSKFEIAERFLEKALNAWEKYSILNSLLEEGRDLPAAKKAVRWFRPALLTVQMESELI